MMKLSYIFLFALFGASNARRGGFRGGRDRDADESGGFRGGRFGDRRGGPRDGGFDGLLRDKLGLGFIGVGGPDGILRGDYVTNITCPAPIIEEPECTLPRGGEAGTWVCRHTYHPMTGVLHNHSLCINPEIALETDDCGCCDPAACPQVCECPCTAFGGREGVYVEGPSVAEPGETVEICLPSFAALGLVETVEPVQCSTSCL